MTDSNDKSRNEVARRALEQIQETRKQIFEIERLRANAQQRVQQAEMLMAELGIEPQNNNLGRQDLPDLARLCEELIADYLNNPSGEGKANNAPASQPAAAENPPRPDEQSLTLQMNRYVVRG